MENRVKVGAWIWWEQCGEFDEWNRHEAENMVQVVGVSVGMVKGVCGNSFKIEKPGKCEQLECLHEWLMFKKSKNLEMHTESIFR